MKLMNICNKQFYFLNGWSTTRGTRNLTNMEEIDNLEKMTGLFQTGLN